MDEKPPTSLAQLEFEALLSTIRTELHRYASRMTGSVIDGEDVVQEALVKAYSSYASLTSVANIRGWLFRITHNKAIDFLRRDSLQPMEHLDEHDFVAEPDPSLEDKELANLALSVFLKLAPRQRSCVILKDVLGYSLAEISELLNATVPEIKAALHRGRTRLRELSRDIEGRAPGLDEQQQALLARYIDRFNARDFDAVRAMLADEVQLDLVSRTRLYGRSTVSGQYLHNYSQIDNWQLAPGSIEGHPAVLVYIAQISRVQPTYFMLLTWKDDQVQQIRDYRYVPYIMQGARVAAL